MAESVNLALSLQGRVGSSVAAGTALGGGVLCETELSVTYLNGRFSKA